ncbi:MAG TPA: MFS transporter [Actinomycetes bacterium]|nr:MFS transporter [Actinomycetes bacterium]
MSPTFRSLRNRNYRIYYAGGVVSNVGTWMQRIAQDWLVLRLSDNDGVALGITTGLQFLPMLLVGPWGGMLADRYSKRKLLIVTQAFMGLVALALAGLDLSGVVAVWHVYVLALLLGLGTAVDNPTRQSFVIEMVGAEDLPNAVGLNSASFNLGRVVGPALAGLLIEVFGTGPVFLLNGLSFLAVILALTRLRVSELQPSPRAGRGSGQVLEGIRYVRSRPDLLTVMVLVFFVGTFGLNFQLTMALMATQEFDKGAGEFGLLGSIMAVGSLSGALLAARRGRPRLRLVLGAALAFGAVEVVSGLMPTYLLFAAILVPVGLTALTFITAANSTMQLGVDPVMRGRVMALYMAVFFGGTPLGAPLVGAVAEAFGARWSLILGGVVSGLAAVVAAFVLARHEGLQIRGELFGVPRRSLREEQLTNTMSQR